MCFVACVILLFRRGEMWGEMEVGSGKREREREKRWKTKEGNVREKRVNARLR